MKISFVMTIYKNQLFKSLKITDLSQKRLNVVTEHGCELAWPDSAWGLTESYGQALVPNEREAGS